MSEVHLREGTALINGATGAVGQQICRTLAGHVKHLIVGYRNQKNIALRLCREVSESKVSPLEIDVTDEENVARAFRELKDAGHVPNILINCAGVNLSACEVEELAVLDWENTISVNLTGSFISCKHALPGMKAEGWGRIINMSSILGRVTPATRSAYGASKHGLIGLTQSLAREVGKFGITVNALCPGPMDTPMVRRIWREHANLLGLDYSEYVDRWLENIPVGRLCTTQEVASFVKYLISEEASFVTGAAIDIVGAEI